MNGRIHARRGCFDVVHLAGLRRLGALGATCVPLTGGGRMQDTQARHLTTAVMPRRKAIALVAHDNKKADLLEWARYNRGSLERHDLYGTGTTGKMISEALGELKVKRLLSGPLGGDQQIGAMIAAGELDALVFFWDPLEPQPHDPDVKALLRIAVLYNIPTACNRATADFVISSPLVLEEYERIVPAHQTRPRRAV